MKASIAPLRRLVTATALVAGLVACGGGAELLVIPLFEFGFTATVSGVTIGVFFLPDTPTANTGKFDTVNMNVDATQIHFDGNWSNCSFTLALKPGETAPAPAAASYSGRFASNDSIELTPTSGNGRPTMTLKRQGTSARQMGC